VTTQFLGLEKPMDSQQSASPWGKGVQSCFLELVLLL
jgi:hypothetical protein